jgi:cytochrome c-type biogenesis protein CcmH/NrfF
MDKPTEEFLLDLLAEIRRDQKAIMEKLNNITIELEVTRNGYSPHQVVELLHWVEEQKNRGAMQAEQIRKSVIIWVVPIVLTAVMTGIFMLYK